MKVTLDTNCVYDLEEPNPPSFVLRLVELGRTQQITLSVPAIAASERQPNGGHLDSFAKFRERLIRVGLEHAELLRPLAYIGLAYIDWCVLSGPELEAKERQIHEILFPTIAFRASDYCPESDVIGRRKWRNAKCDVQAMWCHIHYGSDIFVTRDQDFLKQSVKSRLEALGAKKIAAPEDAVEMIETGLKRNGPI